MAYAFHHYGLAGPLLFMAGQYLLCTAGFVASFVLMRRSGVQAVELMVVAVSVVLLAMLAAGILPSPLAGIVVLALAGAGRGIAWLCRHWLELRRTKGQAKEAYLSRLQAATTALRLAVPALATGVLWVSAESFAAFFVAVSAFGLVAAGLTGSSPELHTPRVGELNVVRTLSSARCWQTAPFYLLEGAGASLRQVLFVSGTMAVVASVSSLAVLEAVSSLLAAAALVGLARTSGPGPSLARRRWSLGAVALAWALLLASLSVPVLLAGFLTLYAFSTPFLSTVKSSLVLKGLSDPGSSWQDNIVNREVLLLAARLAALLLVALIAFAVVASSTALAGVVALMLLLLAAEHRFARKLVALNSSG